MPSEAGPRVGHAIVPTEWAQFYDETNVPAAITVGETIHVTGTTGETGYDVYSGDAATQIRQTFANVALTLAEASATWADVVAMTTYHVGLSRQATMLIEIAAEFLDAPYPAWTAVGVTELWSPEAIIEIACTAVRRGPTGA